MTETVENMVVMSNGKEYLVPKNCFILVASDGLIGSMTLEEIICENIIEKKVS